MPESEWEKGRQIKGTIRGYYLWALEKVRDVQGGETDALSYIIGRWLDKDREEALREFQISRDEFRRVLAAMAPTNSDKD